MLRQSNNNLCTEYEDAENDISKQAKDHLYKKKLQQCEFCEKICYNRYEMLMHNSFHIIIPLLKLNVYECKECLHSFESQESLELHTYDRHFSDTATVLNSEEVIVKQEIEDLEVSNITDGIVSSDFKEEPADSPSPITIKNMIKFEEDIPGYGSYMGVIPFNGGLVPQPWLHGARIDEANEDAEDIIKVLTPPVNGCVDDEYESVNYYDLLDTGVVKCKYCAETFPNRYQAILHETRHMTFKRRGWGPTLCRACNVFVAGNRYNMDRHFMRMHPNADKCNGRTVKVCTDCNLRYTRPWQHIMRYHNYICKVCKQRYVTEKGLSHHACKESNKAASPPKQTMEATSNKNGVNAPLDKVTSIAAPAIRRICDVCLTVDKCRTSYRLYKVVSPQTSQGDEQKCSSCNSRSRNLIAVQVVKKKFSHGLTTTYLKAKSKTMTNVERLARIQKRLKKISMLNKR